MRKMRSLIAMIVSAVAVVAIALLETAEHVEMIERLIPERLVPMISEKLNFSLILVAILIFIVAYFDHKNDKRKHAHVGLDGTTRRPTDVHAPIDSLPVQLTPKPADSGWTKPAHNVQCVGFKAISDPPFTIAALIFRNVPNGKLLGKFRYPRLSVTYYDNSTGLEIVYMCPMLWWNQYEDVPAEIDASESYSQVALYCEGKWKAYELNEPRDDDLYPKDRLNSVELPAGEFRIVAVLSGDYGSLSIPQVTGVLTLGKDGNASFVRL